LVLLEPVTVAENDTVPPVATLGDPGEMETETIGCGLASTVTTAVAWQVGSATDLATTWKVA
jgi:hypothetical protein